tara:strand:- start:399 stop:1604 length:1206 start_codon:yes stop_codon:yes gene_type:complete
MRQESLVKSISVRIRKRAYQVLDIPEADDGLSKLVTNALVLLICLNVIAVILESVENIGNNFGKIFFWFELSSVIIFTIEYIFRIWCCVESPDTRYKKPLIGRLKYIIKPLIIIDLLVIIPFYLSFIIGLDLRILRVIRLLRVVRLTRYSGAWSLFSAVIKAQQKPLIMTVFLLALALLIFSSLMYAIENTAQPQAFADIPSAMWWGLVTLTTVGYGDVTPLTAGGKVLGAIVTVMGIAMYALPAGIVASGFMQELNKRQFMVTWSMVAKVPLFTRLDAEKIAEIANLLEPQLVPPRFTIVRRGETADCMYFIVTGNVEVELDTQHLRLTSGDFFGEIAVIKQHPRAATVVSLTECQLLILQARDLDRLLEDNPDMAKEFKKIVQERLLESPELARNQNNP